ncbi:MAG TPA: 50S ribosomal protein L13 [Fusobacteria bacterium]|nr:50S ribosomal protein L13 [Fusobacteriota bacterium]|tara:strand:+ start:22060 stop:22476 length:417 start_codon:yes stop_codon:yes gene_type:complete
MLRAEDVDRKWYTVDASGKVLGRLASEISKRLMGKHKPTYTFHTDNGDYVIVTNAESIAITGSKNKDKVYYRHSGKPGNLKSRTFEQMMEKDPVKVVELAVRRMLPKNRIGRHMYSRLRVFKNENHEHEAQKPIALEI